MLWNCFNAGSHQNRGDGKNLLSTQDRGKFLLAAICHSQVNCQFQPFVTVMANSLNHVSVDYGTSVYSEPYRAASTPYSLEKLTWVTFYNPTQLDPPDTYPRIDPTTITACTLVQAVAQCNRIGRISNRANTTHEALQPTRPIPREISVTEDLISTVIVGTDFSLFLWVPVPFLTLVPFSLLLPLPSASLPMPFTVGHSVEALLSSYRSVMVDLRLKRICVFSESKIFFKWRKRLWIFLHRAY